MTRIFVEFDLDNESDRYDYDCQKQAVEMRLLLDDFQNELRKLVKYDLYKEKKMHLKTVEQIREIFFSLVQERKVEIS